MFNIFQDIITIETKHHRHYKYILCLTDYDDYDDVIEKSLLKYKIDYEKNINVEDQVY